ncbi:hypothetical protein D9C73_017244 [Collichthys lucidus]|uniref:Uncharacterized protein n=1 Tax=Collichthys lucidus TaxID=240159 RepID=A0A4U5V5H1_COLLU|nr:hypothetical protein D9C73_017244 [Collichthys lucidus]
MGKRVQFEPYQTYLSTHQIVAKSHPEAVLSLLVASPPITTCQARKGAAAAAAAAPDREGPPGTEEQTSKRATEESKGDCDSEDKQNEEGVKSRKEFTEAPPPKVNPWTRKMNAVTVVSVNGQAHHGVCSHTGTTEQLSLRSDNHLLNPKRGDEMLCNANAIPDFSFQLILTTIFLGGTKIQLASNENKHGTFDQAVQWREITVNCQQNAATLAKRVSSLSCCGTCCCLTDGKEQSSLTRKKKNAMSWCIATAPRQDKKQLFSPSSQQLTGAEICFAEKHPEIDVRICAVSLDAKLNSFEFSICDVRCELAYTCMYRRRATGHAIKLALLGEHSKPQRSRLLEENVLSVCTADHVTAWGATAYSWAAIAALVDAHLTLNYHLIRAEH